MAIATTNAVQENLGLANLELSAVPEIDSNTSELSAFGRIKQKVKEELSLSQDEKEPIALTVKIGEETLLDRIIGGINDRSFLNNAGVISI